MKESSSNHPMPGVETEISVTIADLPLHCPMNASVAWASHPRVFLPIEDAKNGTTSCPYCGTRYILSKPA